MRPRMTPRRPAFALPAPFVLVGLALALAACSIPGPSIVASTPSLVATATPAASPTIAPATGPSPTPTPIAGTRACDPASLGAAITAWDAGAGHRNATITLTNNGKSDCTIHALATPQLRGGNGTVLIGGTPPTSTSVLTLASYASVSTMVSVANYCGSNPVAPVTVAFVFPNAEGTVVASPLTPTDLSGVPPCNGPGQPGDIDMHPFAP